MRRRGGVGTNMAGQVGPEAEGGQAVPCLGLGGRRGRSPRPKEASGAPVATPTLAAPPTGARDPPLGLAPRDLLAPSPGPGSNGGPASSTPRRPPVGPADASARPCTAVIGQWRSLMFWRQVPPGTQSAVVEVEAQPVATKEGGETNS